MIQKPSSRIDPGYRAAPQAAVETVLNKWHNATGNGQSIFLEMGRGGQRYLWKTEAGLDFWELSLLLSPFRYRLLCKDDRRIRTVKACELAPVAAGWELKFDRELGAWVAPVILSHLQNVAHIKTSHPEIWEESWKPYLTRLEARQ